MCYEWSQKTKSVADVYRMLEFYLKYWILKNGFSVVFYHRNMMYLVRGR